MEIIQTGISGLLLIKPAVFTDSRGYFLESYSTQRYFNANMPLFIQDNLSKSSYGVVRGLHYQLAPYAQSKLVQVIKGRVLDVAVDLRRESPTYGQHHAVELSDENHLQFFIPQGFAHGFSVLSEEAIFSYKCDQYYNKDAERGIAFNDPQLAIDWKIDPDRMIVSLKDKTLPLLKEADINFYY
jgi:dTDP-4-dehydrorhamnose 3,5-epimerase